MKEPKYTPGPWHRSELTLHGTKLIYGPDGYAVADAGRIPAREWDEMAANADLIATAPEMHELLEEIAHGPYEDSDCRSLCEAHAARARALLDKADGADVEVGQ